MIRVNNDWVVDVDEYNYTLKRDMHRTTRKKIAGTKNDYENIDVYKTIGYFSSLDKALERLGEEMVKEKLIPTDMSLINACTVIRETREQWRELVESVKEMNR